MRATVSTTSSKNLQKKVFLEVAVLVCIVDCFFLVLS